MPEEELDSRMSDQEIDQMFDDEALEAENGENTIFKKDTKYDYALGRGLNYRLQVSRKDDIVDDKYKILLDKPITSLDGHYAKAYEVLNLENEDQSKLYALVYSKQMPFRLFEINVLKNRNLKNFTNIMAAQKVKFTTTGDSAFVVVLERPVGVTIRQFMKENGPMVEKVISSIIAPAVISVLKTFRLYNIVHGRVNIDNIYVAKDGTIILGECVADPCGFSQPLIYETLARSTVEPIAKGSGTKVTDNYAFSVTIMIMIRGSNPYEDMDRDLLIEHKFVDSTYSLMTKGVEINPYLLDYVRANLSDHKTEPWDYDSVDEWLRGRRFNLLPPASNSEATRSLMFLGKKYQNRKYLAYGLYKNWDEAKFFILEDNIVRWVDRSMENSELADELDAAKRRQNAENAKDDFDREDELLVNYIMLLDPTGPIRMRDLSINVSAIGLSLADAMVNDNKEIIKKIEYIIKYNFVNLWDEVYFSQQNEINQQIIFTLKKINDFLRRKEIGFGIKRCLYDLNPILACQSPLVIDSQPFNINEVLSTLDQKNDLEDAIIDSHIACFLSSKIDLPVPIRITVLSKFPDFAENCYIQVLALLSLAQETSGEENFYGLSNAIGNSLEKIVNNFNSISLRKNLAEDLDKVKVEGSMANLLKLISEPKYIIQDKVGFSRAVKRYKLNDIRILRLSNKASIYNVGYRYGLQLSVMVAFIVANIVVIILIMKSF